MKFLAAIEKTIDKWQIKWNEKQPEPISNMLEQQCFWMTVNDDGETIEVRNESIMLEIRNMLDEGHIQNMVDTKINELIARTIDGLEIRNGNNNDNSVMNGNLCMCVCVCVHV